MKSQAFPGFIGPSYQLENRFAAIERTVNWYLVANEAASEESKFRFELMPCPANAAFSQLPVPAPFNQPNRALLELRGTVYGVNGSVVFSLSSTGIYTNIGTVAVDANPATMVANGTGQIFVGSGGRGYVIPAGGGAGSLIDVAVTSGGGFLGTSGPAASQDGYILVIAPNSNQFQISGDDSTPVGDATLWSALNVSIQAGQADYLRAIGSSREYMRLFGDRRSQVYQNVGAQGIGGFPFQTYNETFIETGISAPFSLVDLGNAWWWIGKDARGVRAAWLDPGFLPQRVSTFSVEYWWQQYQNIEDAVAFAFIWMGHLFVQITFPSAFLDAFGNKVPATWLYDVTVSQLTGRQIWTERSYLKWGTGGMKDPNSPAPGRAEMFHCFGYGKHLVGSGGYDGNPGAIYQYSASQRTDCGTNNLGNQVQQNMVFDRVCPHLWSGNKRVRYDEIEFEVARGVTPGQAIVPVTFTGIIFSGSPIIVCSNTSGLLIGMIITATGLPANAAIIAIDPDISITLNKNAT